MINVDFLSSVEGPRADLWCIQTLGSAPKRCCVLGGAEDDYNLIALQVPGREALWQVLSVDAGALLQHCQRVHVPVQSVQPVAAVPEQLRGQVRLGLLNGTKLRKLLVLKHTEA